MRFPTRKDAERYVYELAWRWASAFEYRQCQECPSWVASPPKRRKRKFCSSRCISRAQRRRNGIRKRGT